MLWVKLYKEFILRDVGIASARNERVLQIGMLSINQKLLFERQPKGFQSHLYILAGPTGFYREVNESTVQSPSFTEPLWRSIGLELSDVTTVCQQDGSGVLENVTFLDADANADASLCLPGFGGFGNFIFANPLYISLGIGEEVQIPDDLIGRRLSFVLVTGTCQNPMIRSEPVIITGKISRKSDVVHQNYCDLILGVLRRREFLQYT